MMWLRREMAKRDMDKMPAPSPIENNPVGWSSIYPPPPGQVIENASPEFSPLASALLMNNEQRLGRFWNAATGRAKPYTNADLPQLSEAGREAYDAAAGFVNSTNPIRAYHGSPHTFDRFDMSKIGTGEGAQAYGHGLYFAGNEGVARGYRDKLTQFDPFNVDPSVVAANAIRTAGSKPKAIGFLENRIAQLKMNFGATHPMIAQDEAALTALRNGNVASKPAGSMYEVNLRTTPERLLDWDKPLSQQPAAVREAVQSLPYADAPWVASSNSPMLALEDARSAWMQKQGMDTRGNQMHRMNISRDLSNSGLDGIQYLDAGSRAAGEGSRNYVMFRDDIIDILKRYGIFGLGMVGGATAGPYGADNP